MLLQKQIENSPRRIRVLGARRLISEDELGLASQCLGDANTLGFAAREATRL